MWGRRACTLAERTQSTLVDKKYDTGITFNDKQMATLSIEYPPELPKWNYTIRPR